MGTQSTWDCKKVLESLAEVAAKEVKKGKFTIPGVVMVKTRLKPATKAGKREVFGKMMMVKAKPAKTIVKAFCVAALKKAVCAGGVDVRRPPTQFGSRVRLVCISHGALKKK